MNPVQDGSTHSLFARGCVTCPEVAPVCSTCPDDQICSMTLQTCNECARVTCIPNKNYAGSASASSGDTGGGGGGGGPNIGAIVGGIIGGVVVIAVVTFLIYRFFIKNRRHDYIVDDYPFEDEIQEYPHQEKPSDTSTQYATNRTSVGTMSSTMTGMTGGTRVSIPIAFIPGITEHPADGVPPVPPIPAATNSSTPSMKSSHHSPNSDTTQDLLFMPSDLRGSTYSGYTDASSFRDSSYRESMAPSARGSVTSTMYNPDLTFSPMPAQRAFSGRANVVSVSTKSSPSTPTHSIGVPEMPSIDYAKYQGKPATTTPRPLRSNIGSVVEEREPAEGTNRYSTASTNTTGSSVNPGTRAAIREATRRASRTPLHGGLGTSRKPATANPFSDDHTVEEDED